MGLWNSRGGSERDCFLVRAGGEKGVTHGKGLGGNNEGKYLLYMLIGDRTGGRRKKKIGEQEWRVKRR